MMWLFAILIVQPVFDEAGTMRLVSDADAEWHVDGELVGHTTSQEAFELPVSAGEHEVIAKSDTNGKWTILARQTTASEGATFVPSWTAHQTGSSQSVQWPAWVALAVGIGLVAIPRRRSLQ
jgi:hypothetical protein